jgi:hypothetical protein
MTRRIILMILCNHNFPISNTIAQEAREVMLVECGPLFVIDKMPCGMVRVRWCNIVLLAHMSNGNKTGC